MNSFYEIQHSDGELVQRITTLTATEIKNLRSAGFVVVQREVDTSLAQWLRRFAWSEDGK